MWVGKICEHTLAVHSHGCVYVAVQQFHEGIVDLEQLIDRDETMRTLCVVLLLLLFMRLVVATDTHPRSKRHRESRTACMRRLHHITLQGLWGRTSSPCYRMTVAAPHVRPTAVSCSPSQPPSLWL